MENLFCTYFFGEVFIRFMAFAEKRRCLRDSCLDFTRSVGLPIKPLESVLVRVVMTHRRCCFFFGSCRSRRSWSCDMASSAEGWFMFDSMLVFTMVIETWIMPIIVLGFNIDLANALDPSET